MEVTKIASFSLKFQIRGTNVNLQCDKHRYHSTDNALLLARDDAESAFKER